MLIILLHVSNFFCVVGNVHWLEGNHTNRVDEITILIKLINNSYNLAQSYIQMLNDIEDWTTVRVGMSQYLNRCVNRAKGKNLLTS